MRWKSKFCSLGKIITIIFTTVLNKNFKKDCFEKKKKKLGGPPTPIRRLYKEYLKKFLILTSFHACTSKTK